MRKTIITIAVCLLVLGGFFFGGYLWGSRIRGPTTADGAAASELVARLSRDLTTSLRVLENARSANDELTAQIERANILATEYRSGVERADRERRQALVGIQSTVRSLIQPLSASRDDLDWYRDVIARCADTIDAVADYLDEYANLNQPP